MKKRTTSTSQLEFELRGVAQQLDSLAKFDVPDEFANEPVSDNFFSIGEAKPAPSRNRGQRLSVMVGWVWWPSRIDPDAGALIVRERIREVPGVEQVSAPELDPQLRFVWQATVVIRTRQ